jgi:predicted DsbA family dithiol-disulfide isomerase
MAMKPIQITHFSDTLCVWAYVSQIRVDELEKKFPGSVELDYRYFHVFGNVPKKMEASWKERGGVKGYRDHVRSVVDKFSHVTLHPDAWATNTPQSSMPSHLLLCAVRLLQERGELQAGSLERAAWAMRQAFFQDCLDISRREVLLGVVERLGLPQAGIERTLASGTAHAALAEDLDLARQHTVQASPTLLFNEGRQRLTGNVGYRILEANIRELVENPPGQLSWC